MEVVIVLHGRKANDRKKMDIFTTGRMCSQIFYLGLIEHMSEEPEDVEGYLFYLEKHKPNPPKKHERQWELHGSLAKSLH